MAWYSIRLDTVHLLSTANPYPYWDQILVAVSLDRIGTVGDERKVIRSTDLRTAYIGDMGRGAMKALNTISPEGNTGWEINIPDPGPGEEIQLSIVLRNLRGLSDQEITRLFSKILVFAGEFTADELIHFGLKVADMAKSGVLGVAAIILEHVIDEIFPDPPSCTGLVMKKVLSCNPAILAERAYIYSGLGEAQVQEWLVGDLEDSPGADCSQPSARVQYTVKRKVPLPPFDQSRSVEYSYAELDTVRIDDIVNQWANTSDNSNPAPLVQVVIWRSNIALKDSVNVYVKEIRHLPGNGTRIVEEVEYSDLHVQWSPRRLPERDTFGDLQLPPEDPVVIFHPVDRPIVLPGIDFGQKTACIPLPNGTVLSFWAAFRKIEGETNFEPVGIQVHYSRGGNSVAKHTQCWLSWWRPIR